MGVYKENYYARYVYNAVSEFVYFIIIYIRQNGEANILNITKYMKFFKHEVKCFVETFHGNTLEEKLKNMLCTSMFIFSASDKHLTLIEGHENYQKGLPEDIISSKVIDLILKDVCRIDDVWHNLKLSNVFFFIDKRSLLSMLSRSPHFDIKHENYISINQLKGVLGFDSLTYKTAINYFQSYLQCNKKLSYLELKTCSFLPFCEINNVLKILCIMFSSSSLFKCRKSCIKLRSKLKCKLQQNKKLDLEKLFMKESVCGMPVGYVIYKQHGPRLTSWIGEIGNLSQNYGVIYCVFDFIDSNQGIFYVFFNKSSLQQVSEIEDLRDYLAVRDRVEFHAEYCEGSKDRLWRATRVEVVKTTFKHNSKLICDNSIEDILNSFQKKGGQNGFSQNHLFNQYENNKGKTKLENLNHLDAAIISCKENACDVPSAVSAIAENGKLRKVTELETPSNSDISLKNDQNFVTLRDLLQGEENELKKSNSFSVLNNNCINFPNMHLNGKLLTETDGQNTCLQQVSIHNGSLEPSGNEAITSDAQAENVESKLCSNLSEVSSELVMCNNKSNIEENEPYTSSLHTESVCNNGTKNVKTELKCITSTFDNKSCTSQPNTQSVCNSKTESDQTELKCTTSKPKGIKCCTSLSNTESICSSGTENGSVEIKSMINNLSSPKMNFVFDREPSYKARLGVNVDHEDSLNITSAKRNLSVTNTQKYSSESPMDILSDIEMGNELLDEISLVSSDKTTTSDITTNSVKINEKVKGNGGELKILSKIKEKCANNSSFLCMSNLEFSNFVYMFGSVTIVTADTGVATSTYKCNQFDVFFRFETIHPVSNLKTKLGQKVLLYIPYGADKGNVLVATFVYLLNSKEIVQVEKDSLSAEEFVINSLHDIHICNHSSHYSCLGMNNCVLSEKKSLKVNNAFLAYLHIAFQLNKRFKKKSLYNKRNIKFLKKIKCKHFSDKIIFPKKHILPSLMNCENPISRLSSPKSSSRAVLPSNSSNASNSKSSFGSCSSFLTCESYEDANEEVYYSCDSVFSLDDNLQSKGSIKEPSIPLVKNNINLSSSSHYVIPSGLKSTEILVSDDCDKLLDAENRNSPSSDCSVTIESKQYGDCDIIDSKYLNSKKYLKLRSVPIFKPHRRRVVVKSTNKYGCIKCLNNMVVTKAFVNVITESSLILNFKIKTHNVFLGYPKHLLPDDSLQRIKLNSIVKIMLIPEKILNLSHVLALQLYTS